MMRLVTRCGFAVILTLVAGCSDPSPDNVASPTSAVPAPGEVPQLTTTTVMGARTDRDLQALGLSPEQSSCLLRSEVDRPLDVVLPDRADDPIEVVVEQDLSVTLRGGLRSGAEVWTALLPALAGSCMDPGEVDAVARALGEDDDRRAVDEDLPGMVDARRSVGFSDEELACVERIFREAPVRISSLAADPRVADERCVEAQRLRFLRMTSVRGRLLLAGANPDEATCLAGRPDEVAAIDEEAAALAAGIGGGSGVGEGDPADARVRCLSDDRFRSLAVTVAANDIQLTNDFG